MADQDQSMKLQLFVDYDVLTLQDLKQKLVKYQKELVQTVFNTKELN